MQFQDAAPHRQIGPQTHQHGKHDQRNQSRPQGKDHEDSDQLNDFCNNDDIVAQINLLSPDQDFGKHARREEKRRTESEQQETFPCIFQFFRIMDIQKPRKEKGKEKSQQGNDQRHRGMECENRGKDTAVFAGVFLIQSAGSVFLRGYTAPEIQQQGIDEKTPEQSPQPVILHAEITDDPAGDQNSLKQSHPGIQVVGHGILDDGNFHSGLSGSLSAL